MDTTKGKDIHWSDSWFEATEKFLHAIITERSDPEAMVRRGLLNSRWNVNEMLKPEGRTFEDTLDFAIEKIFNGVNMSDPKMLALVPSYGQYSTALAYFVGILTKIHKTPEAPEVERLLIEWIGREIGFGSDVGGYLTSGASSATLIALDIARQQFITQGYDITRSVVYIGDMAHFSLMKALHILGFLPYTTLRVVKHDIEGLLDTEDLWSLMQQDKENGLEPFLVLASLGTNDLGLIDPLHRIGSMAKQFGAWCHVDAAYGGGFLLCDHIKQEVGDMTDIDSLVLDPHKSFFMPLGHSVVLLRNAGHLKNMNLLSGHLSILRAYTVWFSLNVLGINTLRSYLEEKLLLARYFHQQLKTCPHIIVDHKPKLAILTFRCQTGTKEESNETSMKLRKILEDREGFHLNYTWLNGYYSLRACMCNFRLHLTLLRKLIEKVKQIVAELIPSPYTLDQCMHRHASGEEHLLQKYEVLLSSSEQDFPTDVDKVFQWAKWSIGGNDNPAKHWNNKGMEHQVKLWKTFSSSGMDISLLLEGLSVQWMSHNNCHMKSMLANAFANCIMATRNLFSTFHIEGPGLANAEFTMLEWLRTYTSFPGDNTASVLMESMDHCHILALAAAREYLCASMKPSDSLQVQIYGDDDAISKYDAYLKFLGYPECKVGVVQLSYLQNLFDGSDHPFDTLTLIIIDSPSFAESQIAQIRHEKSHKVWIHTAMYDLQHKPVLQLVDSVSLDLTNAMHIFQPLAVTMVKDGSILKKGVNCDRMYNFRPLSLAAKRKGYNSSDWSFELSKPSRCVLLWFDLGMKGFCDFTRERC